MRNYGWLWRRSLFSLSEPKSYRFKRPWRRPSRIILLRGRARRARRRPACASSRRDTEQNFQIGTLNRPDFLNNFQSVVTADQMLYDGGATRSQLHGAELGHQIAAEEERRTRMGLIA